jgi:FKBP-type peptidyl-prolyl cis-trans isomerase FkpA
MDQITTASGLVIQDVIEGSGAVACAGQTVTVHYTGWLTDGRKFDSSKDRNAPFEFSLGGRQVIAGWDEGVVGMKIGGTRTLTIPPELGYGARGAGSLSEFLCVRHIHPFEKGTRYVRAPKQTQEAEHGSAIDYRCAQRARVDA